MSKDRTDNADFDTKATFKELSDTDGMIAASFWPLRRHRWKL
jgi:hypothetical protein